jgi:hypothetical protein
MKNTKIVMLALRAFFILSLFFAHTASFIQPVQAVDTPELHTYYQPTTDNMTKVYGSIFAAQTFYTDNTTAHTVTSVHLKIYRVGTPGTVTVALRKTAAGIPINDNLATATLNGSIFDLAANIYTFTLTSETPLEFNTQYAIVVSAASGDSANYAYWSNKTAGAYTLGEGMTSATNGTSWSTAGFANDFYFELWGNKCIKIEDVKVFQSFKATGDWLFVVRYINTVAPYYDTYDIKKYFALQFVDNVTVKAQTALPAWGNKIGNIYMSASEVVGLDWGDPYKIRIYGLFGTNPYLDYTLTGSDWVGTDMALLDSWALSSAAVLATYYNTTMTTYIAGRGEVLNATGGAIFSSGINGLGVERPDLFQINTASTSYNPNITPQTYRIAVSDWATNWGPDGVIMLNRIGVILGVTGDAVASVFFAIIMIGLALFAFPAGHSTAANVLSIMVLAVGIFFGVDLIYLGILGIFAAFLLIKNLWLDK